MKFTLTIACDNAAFEPGSEGTETARILRDVADRIETANFSEAYDRSGSLRDLNGNTVGKFEVKGGR